MSHDPFDDFVNDNFDKLIDKFLDKSAISLLWNEFCVDEFSNRKDTPDEDVLRGDR